MFHFLPLLAILLDYFLGVPDAASEPESPLASIISVFGPYSALVFGIAALLFATATPEVFDYRQRSRPAGPHRNHCAHGPGPQPRIVYTRLDSASGRVTARRNLRPHHFPHRAGQSRVSTSSRHEQAIDARRDHGRFSHSYCGAATHCPCVAVPGGNLGRHRLYPGHARVL